MHINVIAPRNAELIFCSNNKLMVLSSAPIANARKGKNSLIVRLVLFIGYYIR